MFLGKTAFAGGARWLDRWCDSRVAKFSGHTSQGTMKVTAIFALFGHSIGAGRGMAIPSLFPRGVLDLHGNTGKSKREQLRRRVGKGAGQSLSAEHNLSCAPCPRRPYAVTGDTCPRGHG